MMRTPARAERDLVARLIAPIVIAAALGSLCATMFAGCEGPGLEPPAHDRNGPGLPSGGTRSPPVMTGGNGGSFGNAGGSGNAAGSGAQNAGHGGSGGNGGSAGSLPDTTSEPDGGTTVPGFDAGPADEDAGVD
jgi:hypothetical protein